MIDDRQGRSPLLDFYVETDGRGVSGKSGEGRGEEDEGEGTREKGQYVRDREKRGRGKTEE